MISVCVCEKCMYSRDECKSRASNSGGGDAKPTRGCTSTATSRTQMLVFQILMIVQRCQYAIIKFKICMIVPHSDSDCNDIEGNESDLLIKERSSCANIIARKQHSG